MRLHMQIHIATSMYIALATACMALLLCLIDYIQYFLAAGDQESMFLALFIPSIMALVVMFGMVYPLRFILDVYIRVVSDTEREPKAMNLDIPTWLPLVQVGLFILVVIGTICLSMIASDPVSQMTDSKPYICLAMMNFGITAVCSYWIKQIWSIYNDYVGDEED